MVCCVRAVLAAFSLSSHSWLPGNSSPSPGDVKLDQVGFCWWKTELWIGETTCLKLHSWSGVELDAKSRAFQVQVSAFCSEMELTSGKPSAHIPLLGTLWRGIHGKTALAISHQPQGWTAHMGMKRYLRAASLSQSHDLASGDTLAWRPSQRIIE